MSQPLDLRRAIQIDHAISDKIASKSYLGYLDRVVIDSRPNAKRFGEVARPFQWERAKVLAPAIEYVAGIRDQYDGPLNMFWTLPKGSDKSSGLARLCNWALAYSKKRLKIYVAASDTDQARIIRDLQQAELELNPWLKRRVNLLYKAGWGPGGSVEFLASDAASAQGLAPDILLIDEVCHWHKRDLFDALFSARNKRPACLTAICTNAGYRSHFSWDIREQARQSKRWYFYESPPSGHVASWMDAAAIAEDRKLLDKNEAARLLDNRWIDASENNGYLSREEVDRCVDVDLHERLNGPHHMSWYAGLDYGPKKDRTALCVLHREADGKIIVDRLDTFHRPGGTVLVSEVEAWAEYVKKHFGNVRFICDKYELEGMIQKFEAKGWQIERFQPRSGAGNHSMAVNFRSLVLNGRISWPSGIGDVSLPRLPSDPQFRVASMSGDTFESELAALLIRPASSGYRFDHSSGRHDDRACSIGMAALAAVSDPIPPALEAPTVVPTQPRDLKSLPFAAQRGLFGVS